MAIIVGSTRPSRKSEAVARWVYDVAAKRRDLSLNIADIAAFDRPLLDEAFPSMMNGYARPHTKAWAAKIAPYANAKDRSRCMTIGILGSEGRASP